MRPAKRKKTKFIKRKVATRRHKSKNVGSKSKLLISLAALGAFILFGRAFNVKPFFMKGVEIIRAKNDLTFKSSSLPYLNDGDKVKKQNLQKNIETSVAIPKGTKSDSESVRIDEKIPICYVKKDGYILGIDGDGNAFNIDKVSSIKNIPLLVYNLEDDLRVASQFTAKLQKTGNVFFGDISQIKITATKEIVLTLKNQTEIFWGEINFKDLENKHKVLLKILSGANKFSYIDISLYSLGRAIAKPIKNK